MIKRPLSLMEEQLEETVQVNPYFFFFCHISVSLLTCIYPCFDIRNQYLCHKIMWHKFISQEFYSKEFDSHSKCGDHAMSYNLIQGRNQYPDFGD